MRTPSKIKMPWLMCLYCLCAILGFITTIQSVFSLPSQFQPFYALFLIPPVIQFFGLLSNHPRLFLIGFYSVLLLHGIEYFVAGFTYGFDRLFSLFGSDIIGSFIAFAVWWSYFHYSKKAALYFGVDQIRLWNHRPPFSSATSLSNLSSDTTCPQILSTESETVRTSQSFLPTAEQTSKSPIHSQDIGFSRLFLANRSSGLAIIGLVILALILGVLNVVQYITFQSNSSEISALTQTNSSLQSKVESQEKELSTLTDKYDTLHNNYEDISLSYAILKHEAFYILNDGTKYYHFCDCPLVQEYAGTYWIHNVEYCEYLGYSPCPYCSPN